MARPSYLTRIAAPASRNPDGARLAPPRLLFRPGAIGAQAGFAEIDTTEPAAAPVRAAGSAATALEGTTRRESVAAPTRLSRPAEAVTEMPPRSPVGMRGPSRPEPNAKPPLPAERAVEPPPRGAPARTRPAAARPDPVERHSLVTDPVRGSGRRTNAPDAMRHEDAGSRPEPIRPAPAKTAPARQSDVPRAAPASADARSTPVALTPSPAQPRAAAQPASQGVRPAEEAARPKALRPDPMAAPAPVRLAPPTVERPAAKPAAAPPTGVHIGSLEIRIVSPTPPPQPPAPVQRPAAAPAGRKAPASPLSRRFRVFGLAQA